MSGWGCAFNCDRCGRFMNPDAPGASFSRTWYEDGYGGCLRDPEFRCHPCTEKHGVGYTNCAPTFPGNGRNPLPALADAGVSPSPLQVPGASSREEQ